MQVSDDFGYNIRDASLWGLPESCVSPREPKDACNSYGKYGGHMYGFCRDISE